MWLDVASFCWGLGLSPDLARSSCCFPRRTVRSTARHLDLGGPAQGDPWWKIGEGRRECGRLASRSNGGGL